MHGPKPYYSSVLEESNESLDAKLSQIIMNLESKMKYQKNFDLAEIYSTITSNQSAEEDNALNSEDISSNIDDDPASKEDIEQCKNLMLSLNDKCSEDQKESENAIKDSNISRTVRICKI